MKITDCTLRARNIVAGIVFCILFAILWTFLAQPIDVSARATNETILETGETKADDAMNGTALLFPEGKTTLDLNGKELNVVSVSGSNAEVIICGKGSLVVNNVIRMPESVLCVKLDDGATLGTNGIYMKDGTLQIESGSIYLNGSYTHAETIRVSGGDIVADTRADGLRADGSFQMTGGTVTANGRTHGLHAEGEVEITGGTLNLTGGNGAFYYAHPELVKMDGAQIEAGQNADSASVMESLAGADGRTFVQIGTPDDTSAKTETKNTTTTKTNASTEAASAASTQANAATSANTAAEAADTQTNAAANASTTANAATSVSTAAANAGTTAVTEAGTTTVATSATSAATEASTAAAANAGTDASAAVTNTATSATSTALQVSAAGSADAASSSAAASGATGFTAPATADSGTMGRGIILLSIVIAGLLVLIHIPEK